MSQKFDVLMQSLYEITGLLMNIDENLEAIKNNSKEEDEVKK